MITAAGLPGGWHNEYRAVQHSCLRRACLWILKGSAGHQNHASDAIPSHQWGTAGTVASRLAELQMHQKHGAGLLFYARLEGCNMCRTWAVGAPNCAIVLKRGGYLNRGEVYTNCPIRAGSRCSSENTGAEQVRPSGVQKPDVVNGVKGFGMPSSLTSAKRFGYCTHTCHLSLPKQHSTTVGPQFLVVVRHSVDIHLPACTM